MTVTFGEFLFRGGKHLDQASELWRDGTTIEFAGVLLRGSRDMTRTLARLATDVAAHQPGRPEPDAWQTAAQIASRECKRAAANMDRVVQWMGRLGVRTQGEAVPHVWAAAEALTAACDLLHTHRPDYGQTASDWTGVLATPELTGALLLETGRWARLMTIWLSHTGTADPVLSAEARNSRDTAYRSLQVAVEAIDDARRQSPITDSSRQLLHSIPTAILPARSPPDGKESLQELCAQARVSAQRARRAVSIAATEAHWSPHTTADSWQWRAEAAAILTDLTGLLITSLRCHHDVPRWFPDSDAHFRTAASAAARSHTSWQQAAKAWDTITTDTRGLSCPAIPNLGDLVLRIGRITYNNPAWTPARTQRAAPREPADLAHGPAQARSVATAVHETIDTLACLATADRQAIHLAGRAWRLHVPTRCLTDDYDIPHRFGPATPLDVLAATETYDTLITASTSALKALEELVLSVSAPSTPLATARQLTRTDPVGHRSSRADPKHDPASTKPAHQQWSPRNPHGPIEQELAQLGVKDPFTLLQAAAIDHAGRELISGAGKALAPKAHPREGSATGIDVSDALLPQVPLQTFEGRGRCLPKDLSI